MRKVLILLSTYNGERYIDEQLDSLFNQIGVDVHILVRDDGSKDGTLNLLKRYDNEHPYKMTILAEENVGCKKSFFRLMTHAITAIEGYDYYAFCDQDDQWLLNKLERAVKQLDEVSSKYKLYFSTYNLVDKDLNFIKSSSLPSYFDYTTAVWVNVAAGCTMVFNRDLLHACSRGIVQQYQFHDAWMWKCANYLDATIIADEEPTINYRQHGNNVTCANKSFVKRYIWAFKRRVKNKGLSSANFEIFFDIYKDDITDEKKEFLQAVINYKKSFKYTLKYLRLQKFKGCSSIDRVLYRLCILFHLY